MSRGALTQRMAILCGGALLLLNVAFYFLSDAYFHSHTEVVPGVGTVPAYSADQMMHIRIVFGAFSGGVAAAGFAAGLAPKVTGHLIAVVFGLVDLIAAVLAFRAELPWVLGITLLVAGIVMPWLAYHSYFRASRPAWAFLIAMLAVMSVVELFGAPKLRGVLDIGLWTAMVLPGLKIMGVVALVALRKDYQDPESAATRIEPGGSPYRGTVEVTDSAKAKEEAAWRQQQEDQARWEVGTGIALVIIGVLVTAFTYAAAANGGTYVVCTGMIGGGAARIAQGVRRSR